MITLILRTFWLIMPLISGAATRAAIQAGIPNFAIFFANTGIGALAWYVVTGWTGGNVQGALHQRIIGTLNAAGVTGRGTALIGYWLALLALISKIVYIFIIILIAPYITMFIYWAVKSMNWSTYYLVEIYKILPTFVHEFFSYVHIELIKILHSWYPTMVDASTETSKWIFYLKSGITLFYRLMDYQWFTDWIIVPIIGPMMWIAVKLDVLYQWTIGFATMQSIFSWIGNFIGPAAWWILGIIPGWIYEFALWMVTDNLFNVGWRQALPQWIKDLFGW